MPSVSSLQERRDTLFSAHGFAANSVGRGRRISGVINPTEFFRTGEPIVLREENGRHKEGSFGGVVSDKVILTSVRLLEGARTVGTDTRLELTYNELHIKINRQATVEKWENLTRQTNTPATTSDMGLSALTARDFFAADKNPIMKAFKSSGGRGLAGVITSFKIDYGEAKANWSIRQGSRAPMFVTINLTLAVMHDITPGLDSNGIMMAPVWPVGGPSNYYVKNPDGDAPVVRSGTGLGGYDPTDRPVFINRKG